MKFAIIFAASGVVAFSALIVWMKTAFIPNPRGPNGWAALMYIGIQFFLFLFLALVIAQAIKAYRRKKRN